MVTTAAISSLETFVKNDVLTVIILVFITGLIIKIFFKDKLDTLKNAASKDDLNNLHSAIKTEMKNLKQEINDIKQMLASQSKTMDEQVVGIYKKLIEMANSKHISHPV